MKTLTKNELIFIRHAKAEAPSQGLPDSERALTESGIINFISVLPQLKKRLQESCTIRLYSSDLLRAQQTAALIAQYLDIEPCEAQAWIGSGEFHHVEELLHTQQPKETLIIVGHEPHLSNWSRRLTGLRIPFRKGCAVGFELLSSEPLSAEVRWLIMQESCDLRYLSIAPEQPFLTEARKIFRCQIHEIFNRYLQFLEEPTKAETTHQFRVRIRAFRSFLSFAKSEIDEEYYAFIQNKLRLMAQEFGRLREIDVLKIQWEDFKAKHSDIVGELNELSALLDKERASELAKVQQQQATIMADIFDVWSWIENALIVDDLVGVETTDDAQEEEVRSFDKLTKRRIKSWQKKNRADFEALDLTDIAAVHELRLQSKKLRYVLSVVEPFVTFKLEVGSKTFRALQELLGDYCDIDSNRALLGALSEKSDNPQLRYEIGLLSGYQLREADETVSEIIGSGADW